MSKPHIGTHLRRWGLKVQGEPGWLKRGRPYAHKPRGVLVHHTASNKNSGNFASLGVVKDGYSGLPGPLCQFLLGRDGTVKIISMGYANHAGYGGPIAGIPKNQGNTYTYGIEAENNGVGEPWTKAQLQAYYRLCAALLDYMDLKSVSRVFGHKEWAPGRKIDPAGINMDEFRKNVARALAHGPSVVTIRLVNTGPGANSLAVRRIKLALKEKGFFKGAITNTWTRELRNAYSKYQYSLGYRGKDADGIPGKASLERLGFRVIP